MKILHYGLGYPPNRSGGLIYYTLDLMKEQVEQGHEVGYLYPGRINIFKNGVQVKRKLEKLKGVSSFELINSLPLPLFGGIKSPSDFMKTSKATTYASFLKKFNPDVIHIHSIMGIHKEFIEVAKQQNIRLVFTSHDYFGLSPNPTFYFNDESWDEKNTTNYWLNVSQVAMSTKKLRLFQLPYYSKLKNIYKKFKKSGAQQEEKVVIKASHDFESELISDFEKLREYYINIFESIDIFHFNSTVAKGVFETNLNKLGRYCTAVIPISNASISAEKKEITVEFRKIKKITYIGPYAKFKGFDDFLELAYLLQKDNYEFVVCGEDVDVELPANVTNRGRFSIEDREKIFADVELLLLPSKCKETFGFLAIEALENDVPVMVSSNVGAKDLLPNDFIFDDVIEIVDKIFSNEILILTTRIYSMKEHAKKISELIYLN